MITDDLAGPQPEAPVVGMEMAALDAGLRHLLGNQFVKGERIVVQVSLLNCTELDRKDRADQERTIEKRRALEKGTGERKQVQQTARPTPIGLETEERQWPERVRFDLKAHGEHGVRLEGAEPVLPRWDPSVSQKSPAVRALEFRAVQFWQLDTNMLNVGGYELSAHFVLPGANNAPVGESMLNAQVRFTLIKRDGASAGQLARVYLRQAQAAKEAGEFDGVILAAEEAIGQGSSDPYDLATLYRLVGSAHEAKGELENAIAAFQQVTEIAETHFPGRSQLPTLMQLRIERLRTRLQQGHP